MPVTKSNQITSASLISALRGVSYDALGTDPLEKVESHEGNRGVDEIIRKGVLDLPYSSPKVHWSTSSRLAAFHSFVAAGCEYFRLCSTWIRSWALTV